MKRVISTVTHKLPVKRIEADLIIIGGGMAGVCCAITAARAGIRIVLVQDRPVLGGNASSEVRIWIGGATSHMGNNNRWAREGGVIDEILLENVYRNPGGNSLIFDTILLEKVKNENHITLLLNTCMDGVEKTEDGRIAAVGAFCSQNEMRYRLSAPLFCDASGNGIVGYLAGAAFNMGTESCQAFGERMAPERASDDKLGHTILFYSKNIGRPIRYIPPSFALKEVDRLAKHSMISATVSGSSLWWLEYGGHLDTIHDSEEIKWELWRVVYGIWNEIKNSGKYPEAENLTLEWVGTIPGKRESRRFEGDYTLTQDDIVEQRSHPDDVSHGGWPMDLHPVQGLFSSGPSAIQWHSRGIYPIPFRCMYSRNVPNLFFAGRITSVSHVAFGSTRVMATLSAAGQAVGMAAALCTRYRMDPAQLSESPWIEKLQQELLKTGQYIPGVELKDPDDLSLSARISCSTRLRLSGLPDDGPRLLIEQGLGQMLPVSAGRMPVIRLILDALQDTQLTVELRTSDLPGNYTPDQLLGSCLVELKAGENRPVELDFNVTIDRPRYVFVCLRRNPAVSVHCSQRRLTGILSVSNRESPEVSNFGEQNPVEDIGVETFEFWCPSRRPGGHNLAFRVEPALDCFTVGNLVNGIERPTNQPNAWVADFDDPSPGVTLEWDNAKKVRRIVLVFDTDFDNPLECFLTDHHEAAMPFCVKRYRITDGNDNVVAECDGNYLTRNEIFLPNPVLVDRLNIELLKQNGSTPAALFSVRVYSS